MSMREGTRWWKWRSVTARTEPRCSAAAGRSHSTNDLRRRHDLPHVALRVLGDVEEEPEHRAREREAADGARLVQPVDGCGADGRDRPLDGGGGDTGEPLGVGRFAVRRALGAEE